MAKTKTKSNRNSVVPRIIAAFLLGFVGLTGVVFASQLATHNTNNRSKAAVLADASARFSITSDTGIANQDGSMFSTGSEKAWIGTGANVSQSYLGLHFSGSNIPAGSVVKSASIEFTADGGWITMGTAFFGDTSGKGLFTQSSKPATRTLTTKSSAYSDNVNWEAGKTYSYDVTAPVQELIDSRGTSSIVLIAKGSGPKYGRKNIFGKPSTAKSPVLTVVYTTTQAQTAAPTSTPKATPTQTSTPMPSSMPGMTMPPMPVPTTTTGGGATGGTPSTIYGAVSADLLGTCPASVHDRYVTTGPDGKIYRTWHPTTVPLDLNNPNGTKCAFAHEHGDNPATSTIFAGAVPFNYVSAQIGMDEPHAGFKCFVHNKGTKNDEGGIALNDSYYCFHMGTGGAARFTTRFHSLDFHALTSVGARMDVQGLADIGDVGTICNEPRQQRTVMGFGCKLDSAYEIWENRLSIVNKGNVVASAITSTAVFDPITVMDPADKTKVVYSWDPVANTNIFKFNNDRSGYRGCDREAYSGPLTWQNAGGSQTYYTDVYGNVTNGGPLKQTISAVGMKNVGPLTQFGGLIMTYKGANLSDPQSQFKFHRSACVPGLGVKN